MVNPEEVKVDSEKAKKWIANGAQMTDTVKSLFKSTMCLTNNPWLLKGVQQWNNY